MFWRFEPAKWKSCCGFYGGHVSGLLGGLLVTGPQHYDLDMIVSQRINK